MKYIKNFRLFENEESSWNEFYNEEDLDDVFLVDTTTNEHDLNRELENFVDGLNNYGDYSHFVRKCCDILRDSILFVRDEEGEFCDRVSDKDYEVLWDELEGRFKDDKSTNKGEYEGESTISGLLKLDDKPVLNYKCRNDYSGFEGKLSNVDYILKVINEYLND